MGTNYYAITDHCPSCGRDDRLHICKSHTSFQGHFREVSTDAGTWEQEPWLTSWADWKAYLRSGDIWGIEDEYEKVIDVEDFIADVERTHPDARRRQYDWVVAHPETRGYRPTPGTVAPDADWLDDAGFSFYGGEFS